MVKNKCLVVSGSSLIQAFDRLEVAENTAMFIINARLLQGKDFEPISNEELRVIEETFKMPKVE
jgi:L-fuculose-phosphate aldolase